MVCKLCCAKRNAEETNPALNNTRCMKYTMEEYKKAQQKVKELETLLPPVYERFIESHRNYSLQLSDFIKVSELEEETLCK